MKAVTGLITFVLVASLTVSPAASLQGVLILPGDKSISHRALLLGALADGTTEIRHGLTSGDLESTRRALEALGVSMEGTGECRLVKSRGARDFKCPSKPLDMGNSGTTARLMLGILAGQPFSTTLTGDASLLGRPMARVAEPLQRMGAEISGPHGIDRLPLTVHGGALRGIRHILEVPSAQVKSALLLAGLFAQGPTSVVEQIPTRDHTERMLRAFGVKVVSHGGQITVKPQAVLTPRQLEIPGDISSAAFFLTAAAFIPDSDVTVHRVGLNPTRTGFLDLLQRMGADVEIRLEGGEDWEPVGSVRVRHHPLEGVEVKSREIPRLIDELPILMVAATQAQGKTLIEGAGELKVKETDRIHSMMTGLKAMGADLNVQGDAIEIQGPCRLKGALVDSFGDHRTAMSLAMAALVAQGATTVQESHWIQISFPGFTEALEAIRR